MKNNKRSRLIVLVIISSLMLLSTALSQTGARYAITKWTVDGGGGSSANGNLVVNGSIGQPDASSTYQTDAQQRYRLTGGFWQAAAPAINSMSPNTADISAGNVPVVIHGSNLQLPITAKFGDVALQNIRLEGTSTIHAVVPVGSLSQGVHVLTVTSAGYTMTLPGAFTVTIPSLISMTPNSAVDNAGDIPIIINGLNMYGPVTAKLGNVDLLKVTLETTSTLHAVVPVGRLKEGKYDLTVTSAGHLLNLPQAFTVTAAVPETRFLAMIYLACDNNLTGNCKRLLNELELAMTHNPDLRVAVLWDGDTDGDSAYYLVQPDSDMGDLAQYQDGVNHFPLGEVNTGDFHTLIKFAAWAESQYPSRYTFLSLVGHGGGWAPDLYPGQPQGFRSGPISDNVGGMLWDDHPAGTLTTKHMAEALEWITKAQLIDVIYLDACLMSTAEVIAEFSPYTKYIVAHENLTWSFYPYSSYLSNVSANTSPRNLAKHIAQAARDSWVQGYPVQVDVLDTSKTPDVLAKLDTLAHVLSDTLGIDRTAINEAAALSAHVDENDDKVISTVGDDLLDLRDFSAYLVQHPAIDPIVKDAARKMIASVDSAVVVDYIHNGIPEGGNQQWNQDHLYGLSLYFPLNNEWKRAYYGPDALPRFAATAWDDFIQAWYSGQVPPPPPTTPCTGCPAFQRHIALGLNSVDSAVLGEPFYLPVTLSTVDIADDLRGLQASIVATNTAVLEPASDLQPQMGDFFPSDVLSHTVPMTQGWDVIFNLPPSANAVKGIGVVVLLPFYARSLGCSNVSFGQHLLTNGDAQTINHLTIIGNVCVRQRSVSGATYLESRSPGHYSDSLAVLQGNSATYSTTTNLQGMLTVADIPPGNYALNLSHPLFVRAERQIVVGTGVTTVIPDIGLWGGDMDQNQQINQQDWLICAAASVHVNDPAFDLNDDGITDLRDCTIVANNIGRPNMPTTNPPRLGATRSAAIENTSDGEAATTSSGSEHYITVISENNGDIRLRFEGYSGSFQGIGVRVTLPAGVTVTGAELSGFPSTNFLHWHQNGSQLYIVAAINSPQTISQDTDFLLIHSSLQPQVDLANQIIIEAVNLIAKPVAGDNKTK